jgi:GNAT superfamily N-acetyltransferase
VSVSDAQGKFAGRCAKLPSLGLDSLDELAGLSCGNALEIVSDGLRQGKGLRVLLVERVEKWCEQAACWLLRLLCGSRTLRNANEAEPGLCQLALILDRRIKTCEVE